MKRKKRHLLLEIGLALLLLCFLQPSLFSQPREAWKLYRFEFSSGVSFGGSILNSSYSHRYSPPFLSGAYESEASQVIRLKGRTGWGANVGLSYFPLGNLGLQLAVEYHRPDFRGNNTPYQVRLTYAMTSPPGNPPYPFFFNKTYGWPDTEGHLAEFCFSLNAVARVPVFRTFALAVSVGPTVIRVEGEGVGLAYSRYWVEDGEFNGETFQLKFVFGPDYRLGANVGAELNWLLFQNVSLTVDGRFFAASPFTTDLDLLPNKMLTDPLSEVKKTMKIGALKINPTLYRLNVGLKYLF